MPYAFCEQTGNEIRDISDEIPFDIPDSWEWCKVGDLCSNISGLSYKKDLLNTVSENMVRVLRGGNILDGNYVLKDDDVFISDQFVKQELYLKQNYMITPSVTSMEHIGKIALIDKDYDNVVVGGFVLMLIPHYNNNILSKYMLYIFSSKYHRDCCRSITHKSGQAFYNLSREKLMEIYVPIPPISEQKRIVAKIEELLPFIEKYDLVETKLSSLNMAFPEALKKSILQDAVQGKLVPQNPDDEPASVLLERIRAEKQELIKAGKIKKDKHESIIVTRDKIPYEIPETWEWVRLGDVLREVIVPQRDKPQFSPNGIPWCRIEDRDGVLLNGSKSSQLVSKETIEKNNLKVLPIGTVLSACTGGSIGTIVINTVECCTNQTFNGLVCSSGLFNWYLFWYLTTKFSELKKVGSGTTIAYVSQSKSKEMLFPLPPLSEQHRIVAKIEELMSFINTISN